MFIVRFRFFRGSRRGQRTRGRRGARRCSSLGGHRPPRRFRCDYGRLGGGWHRWRAPHLKHYFHVVCRTPASYSPM